MLISTRGAKWRKLVLAAFAILALGAIGCGGGDGEQAAPSGDAQGMASGEDAERAFLEAMVPHHESAIAMTDVAADRAESPEIRRIASEIAKTQGPELDQMKSIHQRLLGSELVPNAEAHEELGLSPEEAGAGHDDAAAMLETAEPFDQAFVDEMVPHHEGAIAMAEAVLPNADDLELRELAEGIVATQKREIEDMNSFREKEYGSPVPSSGGQDAETEQEAPVEEHGAGHSG